MFDFLEPVDEFVAHLGLLAVVMLGSLSMFMAGLAAFAG